MHEIVNRLKKLKNLICHNCIIDFEKCNSNSIEYFEWKSNNSNIHIYPSKFIKLLHLNIQSPCFYDLPLSLKTLELKNISEVIIYTYVPGLNNEAFI